MMVQDRLGRGLDVLEKSVWALVGIALAGMDNNVLTQIGFVVLIGLAAKNAILIVEFAAQLERQGAEEDAEAEAG